MDKLILLQKAIGMFEADEALFFAAAKKAHAAAVHEENIPDNKYDTLSLEASYLAQGQADRAQEIRATIAALRSFVPAAFGEDSTIRLGALVGLEDGAGSARHLFLVPRGGGLRVPWENLEITLITPESPMGKALLGRRPGDEVELRIENRRRSFEIVEIC